MRDSFFVKQRDLDGQFPQPTYFWHSCQIRDKARWGGQMFPNICFHDIRMLTKYWSVWSDLLTRADLVSHLSHVHASHLRPAQSCHLWASILLTSFSAHQYQIKTNRVIIWISLTSTSQTQYTSAAVATLNSLKAVVNSFSTWVLESFLSDN